jgi:uncharacterized protein (DUF1501 family)
LSGPKADTEDVQMAPAAGALQGAIAATRFGLGARPGEIDAASAVFEGLLRDHLGVDRAKLDTLVFPDSAAAKPVEGLV